MKDDISARPPDETVAARDARYQQAIDLALAVSREAAARNAPAKFSLRELMLLVTLLAVVLGLIRGFGIWGGLVTFVCAVIWSKWVYPHWHPDDPRRQATMFDWIWGLLMPFVCLICDPFVFRDTDFQFGVGNVMFHDIESGLRRETIAAYCFILWQMLFLFIWLVGRERCTRFAGWFLGNFAAAIIFTALLGMLLIVPAVIGSAIGVGLMGFTPLFTSYVFARRVRETIESVDEAYSFTLLATLGFLAAIVVPLRIAALLQPLLGAKPVVSF